MRKRIAFKRLDGTGETGNLASVFAAYGRSNFDAFSGLIAAGADGCAVELREPFLD